MTPETITFSIDDKTIDAKTPNRLSQLIQKATQTRVGRLFSMTCSVFAGIIVYSAVHFSGNSVCPPKPQSESNCSTTFSPLSF